VFPGLGVRWRFAPEWTLNAVMPKPRLEYAPNKNVTFYGGADLRGSTFRTGEGFGTLRSRRQRLNHAVISYTEIRTGAGVDFNLSPELKLRSKAATCLTATSIFIALTFATATKKARPTAPSLSARILGICC
jgi:hypothetical protein